MKRQVLAVTLLMSGSATVLATNNGTTSQQAASAFGNVLSLDPALRSNVLVFEGFANRYMRRVGVLLATAGGGLSSLSASQSIPCPTKGNVRLTASHESNRLVTAIFTNCGFSQSGVEDIADGVLKFYYLSYSSSAPTLGYLQFGVENQAFTVSSQFVPLPADALPATKVMLNYSMVGVLPRTDESGRSQPGLFRYVLNGPIVEEHYSIVAGNDGVLAPVKFISTWSSNELSMDGSFMRVMSPEAREQSVRTFRSGTLVVSPSLAPWERQSSESYQFNGFRMAKTDYLTATGGASREYSGEINVMDSQYSCAKGRFKFKTVSPLFESASEYSLIFTSGKIEIDNRSTVSFTAALPQATLQTNGSPTLTFATAPDLIGYGGCSY
jgi:hypothetical protein